MPQSPLPNTHVPLVLEFDSIPLRLKMARLSTACTVHTSTAATHSLERIYPYHTSRMTHTHTYTQAQAKFQFTPATTTHTPSTAHSLYPNTNTTKLKPSPLKRKASTTSVHRQRRNDRQRKHEHKHKHKRGRTLDHTGLGIVHRKRRRMDSALPSPSPTPPPRDTWAQYRDVVANSNISMLSPTDLSPHNPRSYAHRRETEAMDALWARPFDVRRFASKWAGGVERVSRQPDIGQRLAMRGCNTHRDDGESNSFDETEEWRESEENETSSEKMGRGGEESSSVADESGDGDEFDPPSTPEREPSQEGPFWFGPPLVTRYSRGAPYTLQRCRARQALSDLLRSPFDNRHFRLAEGATVRHSTLSMLSLNTLPSATTLAAGVPWSHVLAQWSSQAEGQVAIAGSTEHAGVPALLRAIAPLEAGSSSSGSPMITSGDGSGSDGERMAASPETSAVAVDDMAIPFLFVKDADTSSLADAKTALLVSMRASLAIMLRLYEAAGAAGHRAPALPDSAGQAFGLLQNGEAWELYMMHHRPQPAVTSYTVTRLWHGRMDVAVDVVTFQTLCANILASVDERVAFTVECLQAIYRGNVGPNTAANRHSLPDIVIDSPERGSAAGVDPVLGFSSAVASAGASALPPPGPALLRVTSSESGVRSCITPSAEFHIGLYRAGELTVEDRYERISNWVMETSACVGLHRLLQM